MSSQAFREQAALTRLLWAVQAKYGLTRGEDVAKDADAARACVEQDGQATTGAPTATRVIFLDAFPTLTTTNDEPGEWLAGYAGATE